jgi:hypothetical protein
MQLYVFLNRNISPGIDVRYFVPFAKSTPLSKAGRGFDRKIFQTDQYIQHRLVYKILEEAAIVVVFRTWTRYE